MPPEQDDNPFGRTSAWPKMPQGPFKVGIPVKPVVTPPGETPETLPQARQITPVFTRPAEPDGLSLLTRPSPLMGAPRAQPAPRPQPAPEPPAAPELPPVTAAPVAAPPPQAAPPLGIELEPLIVEAPGRRRAAPQRRRSAWPALVAGGVGLAAVGALVVLFNRAGEKAAAPAPAPIVAAAPPSPAPSSQTTAPEAAPVAPPTQVAAAPSVRAVQRRPVVRAQVSTAPVIAPEPPPAAAPPVLEVAPPPPVTTEAAPPPQPAFQRPPPPDPNAPVTTQRPY